MSDCDHAGDGPCTGGVGYFTPRGTDLTLCRRHRNLWRREHGKQVRSERADRDPVRDEYAAHDAAYNRERVLRNAANRGGEL